MEDVFGWKPLPRPIPPEFSRYLSETKEHRSVRTKRANNLHKTLSEFGNIAKYFDELLGAAPSPGRHWGSNE
ncbi:hypothetical protein ANCDUO_02269 [Ancylostoma duodenale]|uniref:Uncharacterized protein n=1 Tax=Ancylostoma duodenale TaxID=51022 RepID=A0A0C2DWY7_9BILA|nr:hypothetical protein ANCDUO_02269 [Ancylostoma duodenale]